ncbi:MAG: ribonuclease P protein component [Arcanobacterium sp.]|nr:ribonuclease P protein component [Arcanobacterium sp.]
MLPTVNRLRKAAEYREVFSNSKRRGNETLIVHAVIKDTNEADLLKVGFVVGKKVGNSVIRHKVTRRLRHIVRDLLPNITAQQIVIRAQKPASTASSHELKEKLIHELVRLGVFQTDTEKPTKSVELS